MKLSLPPGTSPGQPIFKPANQQLPSSSLPWSHNDTFIQNNAPSPVHFSGKSKRKSRHRDEEKQFSPSRDFAHFANTSQPLTRYTSRSSSPSAPAITTNSLSSELFSLEDSTEPLSPPSPSEIEPPPLQLDGPGKRISDKSPGLSRWIAASRKRMQASGQAGIQMPPLSQIIASGLEAANRQVNANKRNLPADESGNEALNALLPAIKNPSNLNKAHLSGALERARKSLQDLPGRPEVSSRQMIDRFLNQPQRRDYSLKAFVDFIRQQANEPSSAANGETRAIARTLNRLQIEVEDPRFLPMEQLEKRVPGLNKHGVNLVKQGIFGELPDVLLRREATNRLLALLDSRGTRRHILLTAPIGEGKTHTIQGLAQRIANQDVPSSLKNAQMIQLDTESLSGNGQAALELFKQLNGYLTENPQQRVILFMDDLHYLGREGSTLLDALKASGALKKSNLSVIGASNADDWRKSGLSADQGLLERFHAVTLPSFSSQEKLAILGRNATQLSRQSGVEIPPEMLEMIMSQANAKWPENSLPRATDLLGLSASLAQNPTLELSAAQDRFQHKSLWQETLQAQKTLKGRFVRQIKENQTELRALDKQIEGLTLQNKPAGVPKVKDKHVRQAMAILTGARIDSLSRDELGKIKNAKAVLSRYIVGQPEALALTEEGLREIAVRQKTGSTRHRPIASMLLCGPTGVGKTETAKVIAKEFMNGNLLRLDMSDYMEKHQVSRLTGAPPGYVGYDNFGLVEQIRNKPNSVIVFDEIEKAHPDVLNVLLQILEEGELRDNQGQPVNFRNAVIVLTSNRNQQDIANLIQQSRKQKENAQQESTKDPLLAARQLETQVRHHLTANKAEGREGFSPEQIGRIDYVIPFGPLTRNHISDIMDIQLREMNQEPALKDNNLQVNLSAAAKARLVELTAASSLPKAPTSTQPGQTNKKNINRSKKQANQPADPAPLQSGARDVRNNFERFIYKRVFADLAFEPEFTDLENATLTVDYDPHTQSFQLLSKPISPHHGPSLAGARSQPVQPFNKTLAFA